MEKKALKKYQIVFLLLTSLIFLHICAFFFYTEFRIHKINNFFCKFAMAIKDRCIL